MASFNAIPSWFATKYAGLAEILRRVYSAGGEALAVLDDQAAEASRVEVELAQERWIPALVELFSSAAGQYLVIHYLGNLPDISEEQANDRKRKLRAKVRNTLPVEEQLHLFFSLVKLWEDWPYLRRMDWRISRWKQGGV